jgi:DNA gyrase subunit A
MLARGISVIGRNTQGVRLITVESRDEQVAAVARVAETSIEAAAAGVEEEPEGGEPLETASGPEGADGPEGEESP